MNGDDYQLVELDPIPLVPTKTVICDGAPLRKHRPDRRRPIYSRRGDRTIVIGYAGSMRSMKLPAGCFVGKSRTGD